MDIGVDLLGQRHLMDAVRQQPVHGLSSPLRPPAVTVTQGPLSPGTS
jgi:hypothetical protein